jgi:transcription antitermination factor NusG
MPLDHPHNVALQRPDRTRGHRAIPTSSGCIPRWHVLIATYGRNNLCEQSLKADGWDTYWPLLLDQKHQRIGPLFGPYGFVSFQPESRDWPKLYAVRGVFTVLSRERIPCVIPTGVIEDLQHRTSTRGVVDDPGDGPETSRIAPGAHVTVRGGPWAGFQGICSRNRRDRLTALLTLFGRVCPVDFRPDQVEAA